MVLSKKNNASVIIGIAAGVSIWQLSALFIDKELIIPRLETIGASIVNIICEPLCCYAIGATLVRIMLTICCDSGAAFICGLIAGLSEKCEAAFSPFEMAMRSIPTMGILLLSLIWFRSEVTPIFVSSLIVFPILYRGVVNGVKNIDTTLKEMSVGYRVPLVRKISWLYLPASIPFIHTAYSAALGLLVKVMVTAEVLSQPHYGIGTEFQIARSQLDTARIFAWSILVILLATVLEYIHQHIYSNTKAVINFFSRMYSTYTGKMSTYAEPLGDNIEAFMEAHIKHNVPVSVCVRDLCFSFNTVPLFCNYSLKIEAEKITCLQGRSGRGKTTFLLLLARFLKPQKGSIDIQPAQAPMSFAYQDIRLLPHLTAEENIRYVLPPRYRHFAKSIAYHYLALLGLQGFEQFLPHQLSGGMQRRVGLARALAYPAKFILLDEAFDSLDVKTRDTVVQTFSRIAQNRKATAICVTHEPVITRLLADNNAIIL